MKAMLLAAGKGLRLRPLTDRVPKCMARLGGRPALEYTIEWLRRFGVTDVMINLHHLPERIRDHFGDGRRWGVRIHYSPEDELLGTAGGVKKAAWFFDGPFVVWYGDNLSRCDLGRLVAFHEKKGGAAAIAVHYRRDPRNSGILALGSSDRVVRFLEKPRPEEGFSNWVSAGIFLLEPEVLSFIPAGRASDFGRDVFPAMLEAGRRIYGYRLSDAEGLWWMDTPEDLRRMEEAWRAERLEVLK